MIPAKYSGECPRCLTPFSSGAMIEKQGDTWYPVECKGCQRRNYEIPTRLNELMRLLNLGRYCVPDRTGHTLFSLECRNEFEAPGCHETWGKVWELRLPTYDFHYPTTKGWKKGTATNGMSFRSGDLYAVIEEAIGFVKAITEPAPDEIETSDIPF